MTGFLITDSAGLNTPFPYDLSECIMRCVGKNRDITSLKNASLVCRSWSVASRTWLFRTLLLSPKRYDELQALMRDSELRPCSFVSHCRNLEIQYLDLAAITPRFVAFFSHLSALCIRNTSVSSLEALFEFISKFPTVCSISLDDLHIQTSLVRNTLPSLPMVRCVEVLGNIKFAHFFEAIQQFEVFPNLVHLGVGPLNGIHMPALGNYLINPITPRTHRSQSLTMSLAPEEDSMFYITQPLQHQIPDKHDHPSPVSQIWSPLHTLYTQTYGVEPCTITHTRLTHFRLKGFVDVRNTVQSTAIKWTPRILASLCMPNLQRIEFDLVLDRAGQLDQYDIHWAFIDLALNIEGCANPERVVFVVLGPSDLMGVADILCRRLPKTAERGILYLRLGEGGEDLDARATLV